MNRTWRQSTAKRNVSGDAFRQGVIDFDFSVGSNTECIMSKSYFRIGVKMTKGDGITAPDEADDVAFANFCPGNLFDNSFFYAGGQNVSSCINYGPQAHALSYRLRKSGAWLNSIGKDAYGICASFKHRLRMISSDNAEEDEEARVPSLDAGDASIRYFMYQPPLGIMENSQPMSAGQYRFQFNPAANFEKACVESSDDQTTADYKFKVESMELYVCEERVATSSTGTSTLHLMEHHVQSKKLSQSSSVDFNLPPSTKAISVFVQSGKAGVDNRFNPSRFITEDGIHNKLRNLQITFANQSKPPTNWTSDTGTHTSKLQQRYLDTQIESGQAFSSGGCESLSDFMLNGPIYHYSFQRDANDRSTQLQMTMQFDSGATGIDQNDNLFVVAHHTRSVEISVESGFITEVTSLNI
jgi:hypothetical protein